MDYGSGELLLWWKGFLEELLRNGFLEELDAVREMCDGGRHDGLVVIGLKLSKIKLLDFRTQL